MTHVMLDLETMSTAPNAAIVQIGAAIFDPAGDGITEEFERTIALQSSVMAGGHIDPKTVAWWRDRPFPTRLSIERSAEPLHVALFLFSVWLPKDARIWANGAAFDPPVLESAYRGCGVELPWHYRNVIDMRTVLWLAESMCGWKKPEHGEAAHTALADAIDQVAVVQSAYRALQQRLGDNEYSRGYKDGCEETSAKLAPEPEPLPVPEPAPTVLVERLVPRRVSFNSERVDVI